MRIQQHNFLNFLLRNLPGTAQAQQMSGMLAAVRGAHAGLAGKEGLKAFFMQTVEDGDGRDVRVVRTAGCMLVISKHTRYTTGKFVMGQWAVATNRGCRAVECG
ncbi:hypothetical protein D3C85_1497570 [compost metagenome]